MKVVVTNRHKALRVPALEVRRLIATLQSMRGDFERPESVLPAGAPAGCTQPDPVHPILSVVFLSDAELAALHGQFLGDPTVTDVITFPPAPGSESAGEICVSADAARRSSNARGFSKELTLYVVHGWLHLAGHDDLKPHLKRRMRHAERRALTLLKSMRAMPNFSWRTR